MTDDKPRAASILTLTECHTAVLDKNSYQRILASIIKKKRSEIVEFLQSQLLFKKLTKGSLIKLSFCFEEKVFKKDHILYSEGQPIEYLYLIKEGDVNISKCLKLQMIEHENTNFYKDQLNKSYNHKAEISILGKGEFLGLYDLESGKFSNNAVCMSQIVTLLQISVSDFTKRVNSQESMLFIYDRKRLNELIHGDSINSIKKIIKYKESSPFRKFV